MEKQTNPAAQLDALRGKQNIPTNPEYDNLVNELTDKGFVVRAHRSNAKESFVHEVEKEE